MKNIVCTKPKIMMRLTSFTKWASLQYEMVGYKIIPNPKGNIEMTLDDEIMGQEMVR